MLVQDKNLGWTQSIPSSLLKAQATCMKIQVVFVFLEQVKRQKLFSGFNKQKPNRLSDYWTCIFTYGEIEISKGNPFLSAKRKPATVVAGFFIKKVAKPRA